MPQLALLSHQRYRIFISRHRNFGSRLEECANVQPYPVCFRSDAPSILPGEFVAQDIHARLGKRRRTVELDIDDPSTACSYGVGSQVKGFLDRRVDWAVEADRPGDSPAGEPGGFGMSISLDQ